MKKITLTTAEQMLFALLRSSLHEREAETSVFQGVTQDDWTQCRKLAVRQGVMALAWDGVMRLPKELQPSVELYLQWALAVEKYERKYRVYCRTIRELSDLYASEGIVTVQLKGVGFSSNYPVPCHREGGDIDIFTYTADPQRMTDAEANHKADALMMEQGIEVDVDRSEKHSIFYYKRIPIENHKSFLNVERFEAAVQVERLLKQCFHPQPTDLLDGECQILTPSAAFNQLFLAFHMTQHYGAGLSLHHLCDWAIQVSRYGLHLPDELTDRRFRRAIAAFTQFCNRYLGTSVAVEGGDALVEEMLGLMLRPKYGVKVPARTAVGRGIYRVRRNLYSMEISNHVLYSPYWKRMLPLVKMAICSPFHIFRKAD